MDERTKLETALADFTTNTPQLSARDQIAVSTANLVLELTKPAKAAEPAPAGN